MMLPLLLAVGDPQELWCPFISAHIIYGEGREFVKFSNSDSRLAVLETGGIYRDTTVISWELVYSLMAHTSRLLLIE